MEELHDNTRSGMALQAGATSGPDASDDLARYLAALARDDDYQVIKTLGTGAGASSTVTELVRFVGASGSSLGPMVRKRIALESGVGAGYEELWELQRAGRRFRHLPRVIDCYKTASELVVVSEFVPGETLQAYAARRFADLTASDPAGLARAVFPVLCDAVAELNDAADPPVIHRDLKPQNIIVAPQGLFLIDLGIARRVRAGADRDTTRFGTRAYAPPEQYGFGQTDVRSDVFALGRILEFCLTGAEPVRQRSRDELETVMGAALAGVVARATALDPAQRYPSAHELKRAFLSAVEGGSAPSGAADPVLPPPVAVGRHGAEQAVRPHPVAYTARRSVWRRVLATVADALEAVRRDIERVPRAVGVLWNALVIAFVALLGASCWNAVVSPTPADAALPLWFRALEYLGMLLVWFVGIGYLLLDKRFLRAHCAWLRNRSTADDAVLVATVCAVVFVVTVIARMVIG